jgi:hypothetical protein
VKGLLNLSQYRFPNINFPILGWEILPPLHHKNALIEKPMHFRINLETDKNITIISTACQGKIRNAERSTQPEKH